MCARIYNKRDFVEMRPHKVKKKKKILRAGMQYCSLLLYIYELNSWFQFGQSSCHPTYRLLREHDLCSPTGWVLKSRTIELFAKNQISLADGAASLDLSGWLAALVRGWRWRARDVWGRGFLRWSWCWPLRWDLIWVYWGSVFVNVFWKMSTVVRIYFKQPCIIKKGFTHIYFSFYTHTLQPRWSIDQLNPTKQN